MAAAALAFAASPAERAYQDGQKAERAGQTVRAYLLYSKAASLEPSNPLYELKARNLKMLATGSIKADAPEPKADPTDAEKFAAITGEITKQEAESANRLESAPVLQPPETGRRDLKLRGDSKTVWEQAAAAFGLFVIFDKDYQPSQPIRFEVADVDYRTALHAVESATNSFAVPLSERVILVAQDTTQKRTELETNEAVAIPIPDRTSVQEAQELAVAVQQTMEIRRFVVDPGKRLVFFRDRVSKVRTARALLEQLLHAKPQVAVEVELLSVTNTSSLSYGLSLPTQFPLVYLGNFWKGARPAIPTGFTRFLTFGGGATLFGIGITNAELFATASKSSSRSVLRSEVRVADGQPGSLHVGDKYPITTAIVGGAGYYAPPQVTFEDLGVVLKITPAIHGPDEVSLDLEAEYKVLGSMALNGIPIISTRKFQAKVRLNTDEAAIVSGLITESKSKTKTGMAFLSDIPILGALFRQNTTTEERGETLLVIRPRVLNFPAGEFATRALYLGSETRPLTPL